MNSLNNHPSTHDSGSHYHAVSAGADLGMKAGCLLSALYSLLGTIVILAVLGVLPFLSFPEVAALPLAILPIYMLILIPVLLLGATTGAILGWLSKILSDRVPKQGFFKVGILVCVVLLLVLHLAFFALSPLVIEQDSGYNNESNDGYPTDLLAPLTSIQRYLIFVGLPGIIYIIGGGWVTHKLALEA